MYKSTEALVFKSANRVAVDLELLGDDPTLRDPDQRAATLRSSTLLAGLLWDASEILLDGLANDLAAIKHGKDSRDWFAAAVEGSVLDALPPRSLHRLTPPVVTKLFVVAVDLVGRLSLGWRPPACVAQELMLRAPLEQVAALVDLHEVPVATGWRETLETHLFEDLDHELLYDPALDGVEEDPDLLGIAGVAPMAFNDWFMPFGPQHRLPPYAEQEAKELRPAEWCTAPR